MRSGGFEQAIRVSNLYVYPGFSMDRQWMIVNTPKMKNIYQISLKSMALIEPQLPERCWTGDWRDVPQSEAHLTLSAPGMPQIQVSLSKGFGKKIVECSLWEWKGKTQDEGDEVANWLTAFLDRKVRLVRYLGDDDDQVGAKRQVAEKYLPSGHSILTTFSYGFQILLVSKDSAQNLYSRMGHELPDDRWRPNIVVEGGEPWAEDFWERVTVGNAREGSSLELASVRPCDRWYMLALGRGRLTVGDTVEVTSLRGKVADYGEEQPKAASAKFQFVGSPEWVLSGLVVLLAAGVYVYLAMHHWSWQ